MFVSVSTHIFVYHEYRDDFLSIVKNSGVNSIEIFSSIPHFPYKNEKFVDEFLDRCEREGIKVTSVHYPLYFHIKDIEKGRWTSLCSDDEELRLASVRETIASARVLNLLGEGILVVHTSFPKRLVTPKRTILFRDSMSRILDALKDGVKIAVENTTFPSTRTRQVRKTAEGFPESRCGVCVDVGHANIIENPVKSVKIAGDRLLNVHFSDNLGDADDHLLPGSGTVEWKAVFQALRDSCYAGPLTLELRDPHKGNLWDPELYESMIRKSVEFVVNMLEGEERVGSAD